MPQINAYHWTQNYMSMYILICITVVIFTAYYLPNFNKIKVAILSLLK